MDTSQFFNTIHNQILGQDFLKKAESADDYGANGIQIKGSEEVSKVAVGVSCNAEFLQKAASWGAQVCITHHGLSLTPKYIYKSKLSLATQKRLAIIFENELTVAGYHAALDMHPKIGNNAQIIKNLGLVQTDEPYFDGWGFVAKTKSPIFVQDFAKDCTTLFHHDVFMVLGGPDKISRIGVCSGGATPTGSEFLEIAEKQIDLHLTGVISESTSSMAKEAGFHYFAVGHYATEVFGVKALAEEISKKFPKLDVRFIDVWNEL
ncbi:Nif3-like dinuclear metal center hexameric protein [Candidatus Beckwithbacteria bacterium]|nr:Nif3-like dinuclear metal center hexameric protein [Candidatus Beckwithbacteria bacterium]